VEGFIKKSIKLPAFTTETQRPRRKGFSVCRGDADRQKASVSNTLPWPKAQGFMENRYLPILHEDISLSVLRVSNEPLISSGEWVVKIVLNVNYFLLLVISVGELKVVYGYRPERSFYVWRIYF
jgi:hypothetical protein